MVDAYYRPSYISIVDSNVPMIYESLKDIDIFEGLGEEERCIGTSLFHKMIEMCYGIGAYEYTDDLQEHIKSDVVIPCEGPNGEEVQCVLEFGEFDIEDEYQNATHSFLKCSKKIKTVSMKKGENKTVELKGLSDLFKDLEFTSGASTGDGDDEHPYGVIYSVDEMTPEIQELEIISRGWKLPDYFEKARQILERIRELEEEAKREQEEEERNAIIDAEYDAMESKIGRNTSLRGIKQQLLNRDIG